MILPPFYNQVAEIENSTVGCTNRVQRSYQVWVAGGSLPLVSLRSKESMSKYDSVRRS